MYDDNKEAKYLIGTIKIDLEKSKFGNTDLSMFNSLMLSLKGDFKFTLNALSPLFIQKQGNWVFPIDGEAEVVICKSRMQDLHMKFPKQILS
jgi:hypothetical protein